MKIYTKNGDRGKTSIIGKSDVSKSSLRVDAYGFLDELNSLIGFANSHVYNLKVKLQLVKIQKDLLLIGSHLADPNYTLVKKNQLGIILTRTKVIEDDIDLLTNKLPKLTNFIIPSGGVQATSVHICRAKTRTFERKLVKLSESETVNENILPYINRLSDYFFTLSRYLAKENKDTEIPWKLN